MATKELTPSGPQTDSVKEHIQLLRGINRRRFLSGVGLAGVAAAGTGLLAGCGSEGSIQAAGDDTGVLNFALNLEYFEATLYSYLVTGGDIPAASTGSSGSVTGAPAKLTGLPPQVADMLAEIYFDELNHVNDLRSALGGAAVPRPDLNLAALGTVTAANFLPIARLAEDVGVTAYAGAVTLLGTAANLQAAAQIMAVEGFHAGALRLLAIQTGASYYLTGNQIPADMYDIKPADPGSTQAPNGPTSASGGFFATAGTGTATTNQSNTYPGMAYRRTTSQVLSIVYGTTTTGASSGGFFPKGMNGSIKSI
ncbi:MAG: ferritin-like domain-containing protein [Acidobacteria bacterium]|nr:ferritin-like domain-containing protein [Acidobacteriota bacterium]